MSTQAPAVFAATRELQHLLDVYLNHEMNGPGDIRGVAGFYQVWEAACLQHARARYGDDRIHTCDPQFAGPATLPPCVAGKTTGSASSRATAGTAGRIWSC